MSLAEHPTPSCSSRSLHPSPASVSPYSPLLQSFAVWPTNARILPVCSKLLPAARRFSCREWATTLVASGTIFHATSRAKNGSASSKSRKSNPLVRALLGAPVAMTPAPDQPADAGRCSLELRAPAEFVGGVHSRSRTTPSRSARCSSFMVCARTRVVISAVG